MAKLLKLRDSVGIVFVSAYLLSVGMFLVLAAKIPAPGFLRAVRALARRPYVATVEEFRAEQGYCFIPDLPPAFFLIASIPHPCYCLKNNYAIGPAHAPHDAIRL